MAHGPKMNQQQETLKNNKKWVKNSNNVKRRRQTIDESTSLSQEERGRGRLSKNKIYLL
jgi:hypothetical protein